MVWCRAKRMQTSAQFTGQRSQAAQFITLQHSSTTLELSFTSFIKLIRTQIKYSHYANKSSHRSSRG